MEPRRLHQIQGLTVQFFQSSDTKTFPRGRFVSEIIPRERAVILSVKMVLMQTAVNCKEVSMCFISRL